MSNITYEDVENYIDSTFGDDSFSEDKALFHCIASKLAMLAKDVMDEIHLAAVIYANTRWQPDIYDDEFSEHIENVGNRMSQILGSKSSSSVDDAANRLAFGSINRNTGMSFDAAILLVDCCQVLSISAVDVLAVIRQCVGNRDRI